MKRGPQSFAISALGIAPSLIRAGTLLLISSTVDSVPPGHLPPLMMRSTCSPNCSRTSSAVTGLDLPERLALVPTIGVPSPRMSAMGTGWLGMRTATVSPPAVTEPGTQGLFRKTSVRPPGRNRSANCHAISGTTLATFKRSDFSASRRGRGGCEGAFLPYRFYRLPVH